MKNLYRYRLTLVFLLLNALFSNSVNANNKNILIVGGSNGIGKALVELYSKNYNVYSTFNETPPEEHLPSNVQFIKINLLSPKSIEKIKSFVSNIQFETIIYNAGKFGYKSNRNPTFDRQDWVDSFVINSIAPIELAFALQNNFITKGGKYVAITSRRGSKTINIRDQYSGRYSYRSSKSALNSALVALSMDLKESGITVLMLHPGQVQTAMTSYKGMTVDQSASLIKSSIDQRSLIDTGKFINVQNSKEIPW